MSLDEYRRKRDFTKTAEPRGEHAPAPAGRRRSPAPAGGRRFVVQRHRATRLHYDFRLEIDGVLVSWAVPKGPSLDPAVRRAAFHVEDHPTEYFDFEGTIPRGEYGAGDVIVWDWGTFEPEKTDDPAAAVRAGELKLTLHGEKLGGRFTIVRTRGERDEWGRPRSDRDEWLLIKKRDEFARPGWDAEALPRSVKTGRTNDEVKANAPAVWDSSAPAAEAAIDLSGARQAPMPDFVEPMKATLTDRVFSDPDWLYELKWDGYRVQAHVRDGHVGLYTRRGNDAAAYFPELARPATWAKAREAIFDGEVVALDGQGRPQFRLLQERLGPRGARRRGSDATDRATLVYEVFDLLYLDGRLLLDVPLNERKRLLRTVLTGEGSVRYAGHVEGDGEAFYRAVSAQDLEGIVAKLRRSRYEPGRRSPAWLKMKRRAEQEVVVGGWTPRQGSEQDLGALVVGVYEDGVLRPAGKVGTGFDGRERARLLRLMKPLARPTSPFSPTPPERAARWVEPLLVARVEFAEWTGDGQLRASSYKGLDSGADPAAVVRETAIPASTERQVAEQEAPEPKASAVAVRSPAARPDRPEPAPAPEAAEPLPSAFAGPTADELAALEALPGGGGRWSIGGHELKLSNLDKVLWPDDGITKRELIRYYASIAPFVLPYLRDRGLTVFRRPNGIDRPGFWQKQTPGHAPQWIRTWSSEGYSSDEPHDYIVAEQTATLAWLGNEAAIDLHPWTSRIGAPERPTWALIDVDPGERTTWEQVLVLTRLYRTALEHLGVTGFPKVTGQRGIQVWVPVRPAYSFNETRDWVAAVSRAVASTVPELVSWEWEKSRRRGLARLDYTQNALNKTLVAPYAVRPARGAPVSAPIAWDELDDPELRPNRWTIRTIFERLAERGDLFAPSLGLEQELPPL